MLLFVPYEAYCINCKTEFSGVYNTSQEEGKGESDIWPLWVTIVNILNLLFLLQHTQYSFYYWQNLPLHT